MFSDIYIPKNNFSIIYDILKSIRHYSSLDSKSVHLKNIDISMLIPLARYVSLSRLEFSKKIFETMLDYSVELYKPIFVRKDCFWQLIIPPVVEKHNEKWYIFDGLHRLWLARKQGYSNLWVLCISDPPLALPSTPLDWSQVLITNKDNYTIQENLRDVNEALIRPISRVFKSSITLFNDEDMQKIKGISCQ